MSKELPMFFAEPSLFGRWLEENGGTHDELWVGFYKKGSGRPSMTWPESVDEALCHGWIDGLRKGIDAQSYMIRFTPRKARSTWSNVNVRRMADLISQGRVHEAGLAAFERRVAERSGVYSFERKDEPRLDAVQERQLRDNEAAWAFFQSQPPWYRRTAIHWVVSAKREDTRARRLATLIEDSAQGRTIKVLTRP